VVERAFRFVCHVRVLIRSATAGSCRLRTSKARPDLESQLIGRLLGADR
jgi:hypothetical protein